MDLFKGFKVESLAFIAFFATLPLYSPNLEFYSSETTYVNMDWFAPTLLVVSIIVSFALAAYALRNPQWRHLSRNTITAAAASYAVGMGIFFWLTLFSAPDFVSALAGVLAAAGLVPMSIAWGSYFSRLGLRQGIFQISCMCALSALIDELLTAHFVLAAPAILLVIGIAVPLAHACRGTLSCCEHADENDDILILESHDNALPRETRKSDSSRPAAPKAVSIREMLGKLGSVLLPTLIGITLFAFTMGLRKILFFSDSVHGEALGAWLAPLALLPLYFLKRDKPLFAFVYQVYLPACAAFVIFLDSFPHDSTVFVCGIAATYVFYAIIGALALATLCAVAHAGEFGPTLVFSIPLVLFSLFSFIGVRAGTVDAISDNATSLLVVISTAYLAYLVFTPGLRTWRSMVAPGQGQPAQTSREDNYEERCNELAEKFSLSPREAEILSYMGHGYAPAYIAKTLLISDSTARSHVRNIYRKVGVSSREELIELFD